MAQNDKIQLFEDKRIRTAWDEEKEEWYFSVVDVVAVLTDQPTLLEIGFQCPVNGQLRVDGLLDTLPTDLRQPQLERLSLLGGDGLDQAKQLLVKRKKVRIPLAQCYWVH